MKTSNKIDEGNLYILFSQDSDNAGHNQLSNQDIRIEIYKALISQVEVSFTSTTAQPLYKQFAFTPAS